MKKYGFLVGMSCIIMILVGTLPTMAADGRQTNDTEAVKAYSLGEVIVSDSKTGSEAVGTTYRITAREIESLGARTLDEALRLVPGLNVRIGGSGTPRIDIRGFRTRHVTLLVNGVPVNDTYDSQFDPTNVPVENIAMIKVATGASSVLYGTGGNGGIINVITKKGAPGLSGTVEGEVRDGDGYTGIATMSGATDQFNGFISASVDTQDAFPLSNAFNETKDQGSGDRVNSDRDRQNFSAQTGWTPNAQTEMGFSLNYVAGDNGIPPVTNNDKEDIFTKKPKFDRIDDQEGLGGQLALRQDLGGTFAVRGWGYLNRLDLEENRYDSDDYDSQDTKGAYRQNSTAKVIGANVQLSADLKKMGLVTLGVIKQKDSWNADGFEVKDGGSRKKFANEHDLDQFSTALEYQVDPMQHLGLVAGLGWHSLEKESGDEENDATYMIGTHLDLATKTRLKASYSRKIRFPSIRQLYDLDAGNEDLTAERSNHVEAGIEQQLPGATTVSLSAYHIKAKDFIEKDDGPYLNHDEYLFKGFDVDVRNNTFRNLSLRLSYGYLEATDESEGAQKDELQHRPEHRLTVAADYRMSVGMKIHTDVVHVADQYFYDSDGEDPLEKAELGDCTIVNLRLSQEVFSPKLEIYGGADNLFDEDYEESYGLPQAGRVVYVGVRHTF